MRDRKFKAWLNLDEELGGKKMYDVKGWVEGANVMLRDYGVVDWDEVTIIESTGVEDSEGNEIFEGDVLHRESHWLVYVEYINGSYCLVAVDSAQRMNWIPIEIGSDMISGVKHRRIVGNVIANPEILDTNGDIVYEKEYIQRF